MIAETIISSQLAADYDSPWKDALDFYFRSFMEVCLPAIAKQIDWCKGYESLDKELQAIAKSAGIGRRAADKLIKVWEKGGKETWVLCHLEVQRDQEKAFPERMLVYYYRIRDKYNKPIISVAILIDDNPNWRPDRYCESHYGCSLSMRYQVVKILDFSARKSELEAMDSPFATIILAQLAVIETSKNPQALLQAKTALTRQLFKKNWSKEQILTLFRLLDWLVNLPKQLMIQYEQIINQIGEEGQMSYITPLEQLWLERGIEQGVEQGVEQGIEQGIEQGLHKGETIFLIHLLKRRFNHIPDYYLQRIHQADADTLLVWGDKILSANSIEDVFV